MLSFALTHSRHSPVSRARCNADIPALGKLEFNPLPPALKRTILGVAQTYWPLNYKGNLTETDNKIPNL